MHVCVCVCVGECVCVLSSFLQPHSWKPLITADSETVPAKCVFTLHTATSCGCTLRIMWADVHTRAWEIETHTHRAEAVASPEAAGGHGRKRFDLCYSIIRSFRQASTEAT